MPRIQRDTEPQPNKGVEITISEESLSENNIENFVVKMNEMFWTPDGNIGHY